MWNKFKTAWLADRYFYAHVLTLAVPMIVQNAITSLVSFLDNIMVGQIGTEQMSGVAIINQLMFVYTICIWGGVAGPSIFGTQYFGKKDYVGQRYAFRLKLYIVMAIAAVTVLLFGFQGKWLISLYLSDAGSIGNTGLALEYGHEYLMTMIVGLIPFAISNAYISSIRETGQTFVPMLASSVAVGINLLLDYVLIFGAFGAPELGVRGAAIATVLARFAECLIVVIWAHAKLDKNPYLPQAYACLTVPKSTFAIIMKKGTPLIVNEMLWALGMTIVVQCYSVRGLEVVAAQNISSTITNLFNIVYIQLGNCIAIVVGQLLGAGRLQEAKDADNKMIFFCVSCCAVVAAIMVGIGGYFPRLYNTETQIKALAGAFIVVSALVMPVSAFTHCTYFTLRSGGRTVITFLFDCLFLWGLVIPCAYILSRHTALPIITVFFIVQFMEVIKAGIGFFMLRSNIWLQNIVDDIC